jgi:serine/threonine-protein kinase
MSKLKPDWWEVVNPYLEQALEVPEEERPAWLASLHEENPSLASQLQTLLEEQRLLAEEGFLEQPPIPPPGKAALAGQTVGAYRLVSPIGQGGMGSVWLGERSDGRFERRVAIKFLSMAVVGLGGQERFKREGAILGRLAHPHIAELLDAGVSSSGQPYLVLEYVEGEPIDQYCDQRLLEVDARVRLFLDVLAALAQAHASLIVHRDLKPSNVLVRTDGQVKLLDFGIAKLLEEESRAATLLTREAGGALTPAYAAPEQLTGQPITTATDIYALGVLLYLLLTGQHPAGSSHHSPSELVKAIVDLEPTRPSEVVRPTRIEVGTAATNATKRATSPDKLRRFLRGDLDTIVGKALKKNPKERYASVTAMADDLRRYLRHEPISARPDTLSYRSARFVGRNRAAVALATLAFLVSLAGVVGTLLQARTARAQRDFALSQLSRAEAINDLNAFVLSDAAPSGKPFTVNDLLARAEHIVERQHGGSDADRVELLISLGRQYYNQDEDARARQVLERAYLLSRSLVDPSAGAKASCALGSALARASELTRAKTLVQEGLRKLPREPQFVLDRVFCLRCGSEVARDSFAPQEAIAQAQAALQLIEQSPLRSELLELNGLMDLAESYRIGGQYREAVAGFGRAWVLMTAVGRDDTQNAGTLLNNWALALDGSGRPMESERIYRRAIDLSRADHSEQAVSPMLLINYARILRKLGRLDEAAGYAERGLAKAQQADDQVVIWQSLLTLGRIYRERGELTRAAAMLSQVEPRLRRIFPANHYVFAVLSSEYSRLTQARGDLRSALDLANQAIAIWEASARLGQQGEFYLPDLLMGRSDIERQINQPQEAAADATRALNMLKNTVQPGTFSSFLGHAYLTLGRALEDQGRREEANAEFRSAAEHLQNTLGPQHPDTLSAQRLANLNSESR